MRAPSTRTRPSGGAGGTGGKGGDGLGGGLCNQGSVTLIQCLITGNKAQAGAAGSGGLAGEAWGGGVYNDLLSDPAATISIDAWTLLYGNTPDDRFGC